MYVEPCSGLARTASYVEAEVKVLNDRSGYANEYCRKHFPKAIITNMDFIDCIKQWDNEDVYFLVDPPWFNEIYAMDKRCFIDRPHQEYYKQFLEMAPKLRADWMLCSDAERKLPTDKYHSLIVKEDGVIFGKAARTLLLSNKPFKSFESLDALLAQERLQ